MTSQKSVWDIPVYSETNSRAIHWLGGQLELYFQSADGILSVGSRKDSTKAPVTGVEETADPLPEDIEIVRFALSGNTVIKVLPAVPDLPIVLKPLTPFTLIPGVRISVFIHLPLTAVIEQNIAKGKRPGRILKEYQQFSLSKTWFGTTTAGELCYAHPCTFYTHPEPVLSCFANVPLILENTSESPLPVEKVCLHTDSLELYGGTEGVWTNSIHVQYRGGDQGSSIKIGSGPPSQCSEYELHVSPRGTNKKNFVQKTFDIFRLVTGV